MAVKFFKVVLEPINNEDVLKFAYKRFRNQHVMMSAVDEGEITLEERIGDGKCDTCGHDTWMILPLQFAIVKSVEKPYIQCMNCGSYTHL